MVKFFSDADVITSGFVTGVNQIWLDAVQCTGSESRLIDCPASPLGSYSCNHLDDAGIRCETAGK